LKVRFPLARPAIEVYIFLGVNTGVPQRQPELDSCFVLARQWSLMCCMDFLLASGIGDLKERKGRYREAKRRGDEGMPELESR